MNAVSPERNYAIDWLRVFAMFTVFLFHCARFFDRQDWHVKNPQSDTIITFIVLFLAQWIMPLFFILSGISSYYSLGFRKAGEYVRGRFKRLMIPLIFGIFVLIPPQVYFERISHSQFKGSFIQFFPHYFDGFYAFGGNFAWMGLHLDYIFGIF
jgi:surface polysaccharide O-acyltransferase-like enzyme